MNSLRDQLLKVGLVTEQQAKKAAQQEQQRQFRHRPPKPKDPPRPSQKNPQVNAAAAKPIVRGPQGPTQSAATLAAQQAQAAKVARDQELNRKREEKAKRRAKIAEIEQIIEQNRVPRLETEDYYSFIDGKKIRRMSVDADRREKLTSGVLVVVRYKGHYAVVPKETAERIRERDENMVIPTAQTKESPAPEATAEDPYKDFVVPDDLMW